MWDYGEPMVKKLPFPTETEGNFLHLFLHKSMSSVLWRLITAWNRRDSKLGAFYWITAVLNDSSLQKSE